MRFQKKADARAARHPHEGPPWPRFGCPLLSGAERVFPFAKMAALEEARPGRLRASCWPNSPSSRATPDHPPGARHPRPKRGKATPEALSETLCQDGGPRCRAASAPFTKMAAAASGTRLPLLWKMSQQRRPPPSQRGLRSGWLRRAPGRDEVEPRQPPPPEEPASAVTCGGARVTSRKPEARGTVSPRVAKSLVCAAPGRRLGPAPQPSGRSERGSGWAGTSRGGHPPRPLS